MLLPGSSVVSRFTGGTGQPLQDIVTWNTGLGALSHVTGPTDQNLGIHAPASRSLVLEANASLVGTMDGTTVSWADQLTWDASLGAITHVLGPSDQNLIIEAPASRSLLLHANAVEAVNLDGSNVLFPNTQNVQSGGANGAIHSIETATEELTGLTGASVTTTALIPAGAMILGVATRVTTTITGATTFDVGDGTDVDAFGAAIALAAGTTTDLTDYTITAPPVNTAATEVVLTANGSNFTAGAVRIVVWYTVLTAPTS